jgi:nucleoid DNA-binding protein
MKKGPKPASPPWLRPSLARLGRWCECPDDIFKILPEAPMNKEDVVKAVSEKTGVAPDAIEKVVKAFESQAGDALTVGFEGIKTERATLLAGISQKTGIPADTCDKVLTALQETVSSGISEKLGFLKGLFSR